MSGDRLLDEYERVVLDTYKARQKGLRQFAEDVIWFGFDNLNILSRIQGLSRADKLLLMEQYMEDKGYYEYGRWMATEKEKDDFFWEALEHMSEEGMSKEIKKVEDPKHPLYKKKIQKFMEEMKFFCLDFMPDERKFSEKSDTDKVALMHQFNDRIGLKNVGIWVEDEERFFEHALDSLKK